MATKPFTPLMQFGSKKVYLPDFTITLLRTPQLSPFHAHFAVPLWFSKLDLRDYLWHAYRVKTHDIRSHIRQPPIQSNKDGLRKHWRPKSEKFMTVEMEKPFVWPKEPEGEEWAEWGRDYDKGVEKEIKEESGLETQERALREQARALLEGKKVWKGTQVVGKGIKNEGMRVKV